MSAYNMSRTKYIKENSYYEDSAFAFAPSFVTDFTQDFRNKEREEEKIVSQNSNCLKSKPAFLLAKEAQEKSLAKEKRRGKVSRSAESDKGSAPLTAPPFEKGGRKLFRRFKSGDFLWK